MRKGLGLYVALMCEHCLTWAQAFRSRIIEETSQPTTVETGSEMSVHSMILRSHVCLRGMDA